MTSKWHSLFWDSNMNNISFSMWHRNAYGLWNDWWRSNFRRYYQWLEESGHWIKDDSGEEIYSYLSGRITSQIGLSAAVEPHQWIILGTVIGSHMIRRRIWTLNKRRLWGGKRPCLYGTPTATLSGLDIISHSFWITTLLGFRGDEIWYIKYGLPKQANGDLSSQVLGMEVIGAAVVTTVPPC